MENTSNLHPRPRGEGGAGGLNLRSFHKADAGKVGRLKPPTSPSSSSREGKGSLGTPGSAEFPAHACLQRPALSLLQSQHPRAGPGIFLRARSRSLSRWSQHPGIHPQKPAGFQQGGRPLVATVGRRVAAGSSTRRRQATAPLSLVPPSPSLLFR